ncbi:hypothetical protein SLA2020_232630 [Shorea laevis]
MKFLFWNVRGINMPRKQKDLKKYLREYNADIVCLVETHVQQFKFDLVAEYILPRWQRFCNYECAASGRIWILWRDHIHFQVHSMSHQAIHGHIMDTNTKHYTFVSFIYAECYDPARRPLLG